MHLHIFMRLISNNKCSKKTNIVQQEMGSKVTHGWLYDYAKIEIVVLRKKDIQFLSKTRNKNIVKYNFQQNDLCLNILNMLIWICILLSQAVLCQMNNGVPIATVIDATDTSDQNCCRMVNITETFTRYVEKCFTTYVSKCHYQYDDTISEPCNSGCNRKVNTYVHMYRLVSYKILALAMCSWLADVMVTSRNSNVIREVMVTSNNVAICPWLQVTLLSQGKWLASSYVTCENFHKWRNLTQAT